MCAFACVYMQTDVYANLLLLLCHTSTMERDMALRASSCMLVLHVRTCVHMRKRFLCECAGTGTDIDIHETVFHVCALSLCVCAIIMMMVMMMRAYVYMCVCALRVLLVFRVLTGAD